MRVSVRVQDIPSSGKILPVEMSAEELKEALSGPEAEGLDCVYPLKADLRLEKTGQKVVVRGRVETGCEVSCARCLKDFVAEVKEKVFIVYTPEVEPLYDDEITGKDLSQEYYEGEEIDLWPVIEEHIYLGMPVKPICSEGCRGLCPTCGRDLNEETCGCPEITGHPAMAVLEKLKNKLPNS